MPEFLSAHGITLFDLLNHVVFFPYHYYFLVCYYLSKGLFFFYGCFYYFCNFIFDCPGSSLLLCGLSLVWRVRAALCCNSQASHDGGFSCCGAPAVGMRPSVDAQHRLSSCGAWA